MSKEEIEKLCLACKLLCMDCRFGTKDTKPKEYTCIISGVPVAVTDENEH